MKILINALGIQDSGGITVLGKLLQECAEKNFFYLIICNENSNINKLRDQYNVYENFYFLSVEAKGFMHRLFYENIIFQRLIKKYNIDLVYNFSGSAQFCSKTVQLTKVHNLLFYSKKIDQVYFGRKEYLKWLKQLFLKRIMFHVMVRQTKYVEVQSNHVKEYISDFLNLKDKKFFVKSDINVDEKEFSKPKKYDFSKKLKFLYIVGPHFEYIHKNFIDFTNVMLELLKLNVDFEINITLTKEQLNNSSLWNTSLNENTNFLGYINERNIIDKLFCDNTIVISTSIIETLGLHVIEAIKKGVIPIVPNEKYSYSVYGKNIQVYDLFDTKSLLNILLSIINNQINYGEYILTLQNDLIENEKKKEKSIVKIFEKVINVQR